MDESEPKDQAWKQISDRLVADFTFDYSGFSGPIQWTDGVGLSRIKKRANSNASLFKIGIGSDQLRSDTSRKKLWVSESYGEEHSGGIKFGDERKISDPVDIDFRDGFEYDVSTNKYYQEGQEVTAPELLQYVDNAHTRPTRVIRGFWVRCRLWFWRRLLPTLIILLDTILVKLLWIISGEKIKESILRRLMLIRGHLEKIDDQIYPTTIEVEESTRMNFFGYKAKRWSVVFYCASQLVIFFLIYYFEFSINWIHVIANNNLLALCYVVVSFAVTEALVPQTLKAIINKINPVVYRNIMFKRLKV